MLMFSLSDHLSNERTNERTNERMNERTNERTKRFPHLSSVHSGIPLSVISSAMASSVEEDGPGGSDAGMTARLLAEKSLSLPSSNDVA
jgi:hypothetical protein